MRFLLTIFVAAALLSCSSDQPVNTIANNTPDTAVTAIHIQQPHQSSCIIEDKTGNIWFTTPKNGVYRFNGTAFTHFTTENGLGFNDANFVMEDESGKIWVGTADGLSYFNGTGFTTISPKEIRHDSAYVKTTYGDYKVPVPHENGVTAMMQDKSGLFWLGTFDGVYHYDGKSFSKFYPIDSTELPHAHQLHWTESIIQDRDGNVWIGGRGDTGVFCFTGDRVINIQPDGDNWVRPLMQDRTGMIWFGSREKFIYTYDPRTGTLNDSSLVYFDHASIDDWVFSMTDNAAGNYWFRNIYYDGSGFKKYSSADGFCFGADCYVMVDHKGNTWFTDRNSLCMYDGKTFTSYSDEK